MGIQYSGAIVLPQGGFTVKKAVTLPDLGSDPHWSNVIVLAKFDSNLNNEVSGLLTAANGTPSFTTDAVFGTHSFGGGARLQHSGGFAPTNGQFTIEAWVKTSDNSSAQQIVCDDVPFQFFYRSNANALSMAYNNGGSRLDSMTDIADGQWHHVAVTHDSTTLRIFVDGTMENSVASTETWDKNLYIGGYGASAERWGGSIDELRVTENVCRYTGNFTVPTAEFPIS